jgi:hypothetical protein
MINWAYVAGFCDGEGTIRQNYIRLYQRDPKPLNEIAAWLNKHGIYCTVRCRKTPRVTNFLVIHQESSLNINRYRDMRKFIEGVMPYLIVKKTIAQDVLRYMKLFLMDQRMCGQVGRETLAKYHHRKPLT